MGSDILHALFALLVFLIPMAFAWFAVSRTARRHRARAERKDRRVR
jgi:hypothetical protein